MIIAEHGADMDFYRDTLRALASLYSRRVAEDPDLALNLYNILQRSRHIYEATDKWDGPFDLLAYDNTEVWLIDCEEYAAIVGTLCSMFWPTYIDIFISGKTPDGRTQGHAVNYVGNPSQLVDGSVIFGKMAPPITYERGNPMLIKSLAQFGTKFNSLRAKLVEKLGLKSKPTIVGADTTYNVAAVDDFFSRINVARIAANKAGDFRTVKVIDAFVKKITDDPALVAGLSTLNLNDALATVENATIAVSGGNVVTTPTTPASETDVGASSTHQTTTTEDLELQYGDPVVIEDRINHVSCNACRKL